MSNFLWKCEFKENISASKLKKNDFKVNVHQWVCSPAYRTTLLGQIRIHEFKSLSKHTGNRPRKAKRFNSLNYWCNHSSSGYLIPICLFTSSMILCTSSLSLWLKMLLSVCPITLSKYKNSTSIFYCKKYFYSLSGRRM